MVLMVYMQDRRFEN